jgi:hypothetical protein
MPKCYDVKTYISPNGILMLLKNCPFWVNTATELKTVKTTINNKIQLNFSTLKAIPKYYNGVLVVSTFFWLMPLLHSVSNIGSAKVKLHVFLNFVIQGALYSRGENFSTQTSGIHDYDEGTGWASYGSRFDSWHCSILQNIRTGYGAHPVSSATRDKRPGREANH